MTPNNDQRSVTAVTASARLRVFKLNPASLFADKRKELIGREIESL
jgi:hypothetical protein